jgi:hypothetical protein
VAALRRDGGNGCRAAMQVWREIARVGCCIRGRCHWRIRSYHLRRLLGWVSRFGLRLVWIGVWLIWPLLCSVRCRCAAGDSLTWRGGVAINKNPMGWTPVFSLSALMNPTSTLEVHIGNQTHRHTSCAEGVRLAAPRGLFFLPFFANLFPSL